MDKNKIFDHMKKQLTCRSERTQGGETSVANTLLKSGASSAVTSPSPV